MLHVFWNLMAVLGCITIFLVLIVAICLAASPKDRRHEDAEQMNYLKGYYERKDNDNG